MNKKNLAKLKAGPVKYAEYRNKVNKWTRDRWSKMQRENPELFEKWKNQRQGASNRNQAKRTRMAKVCSAQTNFRNRLYETSVKFFEREGKHQSGFAFICVARFLKFLKCT